MKPLFIPENDESGQAPNVHMRLLYENGLRHPVMTKTTQSERHAKALSAKAGQPERLKKSIAVFDIKSRDCNSDATT